MLTASSHVGQMLKNQELLLEIDLKPALSDEQLDHRILRDLRKQEPSLKMTLGKLFPAKLIPVMVELGGSIRKKGSTK